ncbi:MAG: hypothetical protein Q9163_004121 [Psora crenata]
MSWYLTPSKIGLLVLIRVYAEREVPPAAAVPILSFLVSHVLPTAATTSAVDTEGSLKGPGTGVDALRHVTAPHVSELPGRTIWDHVLCRLWLLACHDSFQKFFEDLPAILQPVNASDDTVTDLILLSRVSLLGKFVVRCRFEFLKFGFFKSMKFWQRFLAYRHPTQTEWEKGYPAASARVRAYILGGNFPVHGGALADAADADKGDLRGLVIANVDIEQLLQYQLDRMQRLGTRLPAKAVSQLRQLAAADASMPGWAQYIMYLDAWWMGDYSGAFENLHRYFDYGVNTIDRKFYEYGLLNLAVLHADFGAYSDAIIAMQEAGTTARENDDQECVQYCLSWLYNVGKMHPEFRVKLEEYGSLVSGGWIEAYNEALINLKEAARDENMWSLYSASLLSQAVLFLNTVSDLRE